MLWRRPNERTTACEHMKDISQNETKCNEIATTYLHSLIGDAVKITLHI